MNTNPDPGDTINPDVMSKLRSVFGSNSGAAIVVIDSPDGIHATVAIGTSNRAAATPEWVVEMVAQLYREVWNMAQSIAIQYGIPEIEMRERIVKAAQAIGKPDESGLYVNEDRLTRPS